MTWDYTDITAIGGKAGSKPSVLLMGNLATPYLSRKGKQLVREADGDVGRGWWRKRTPTCSGSDKD
jgi:hypothetical protein